MIVGLTARLIALPEMGWPRLAAALDGGEALPSPAAHAAAVAGLAVVATFVGASIEAGASVGSVVIEGLTAVAGYVGAAVLVTAIPPASIGLPPADRDRVARLGSAAALPVLASGIFDVIPMTGLAIAWTLLGAAATGWSGWLGASALLGIEGGERRKAAATVTIVATAPILLATLFRIWIAH